ncbi:MAG: hypothetical protein AAF602_25745, partial [Myxococcota bacterium]
MTPTMTLLLSSLAPAATLTVTVGDDSGAGSLREAVAAAQDGDDIEFNGVATVTLSSTLTIERDLIVEGGGVSIASDGSNHRMLQIAADAEVTLRDLEITGGRVGGTNRAAGLANFGTATLQRVVIRDCQAFNAAGFENYTVMTLEDSAIIDNRTTGNSGAGGTNGGTLTVRNTTFASNHATGNDRVGGGLAQFSEDATAVISH